jgi:hypothetical protein
MAEHDLQSIVLYCIQYNKSDDLLVLLRRYGYKILDPFIIDNNTFYKLLSCCNIAKLFKRVCMMGHVTRYDYLMKNCAKYINKCDIVYCNDLMLFHHINHTLKLKFSTICSIYLNATSLDLIDHIHKNYLFDLGYKHLILDKLVGAMRLDHYEVMYLVFEHKSVNFTDFIRCHLRKTNENYNLTDENLFDDAAIKEFFRGIKDKKMLKKKDDGIVFGRTLSQYI